MTREKTISKDDDSNSLDIDNVIKLDEHNPLGDIGSEMKEQMVDVVDIHIPSVRSILGDSEPTLEIVAETDSGHEVSLDLVLDRFSEEETNNTSLTSFCMSLDIDRDQLYGLIDKEIPLKISRTGEKFEARVTHDTATDIDPDVKNNSSAWRWRRLMDLWEAEEYGEVRITKIDRITERSVILEVEIPWVDETWKMHFNNGKTGWRSAPNFLAFYNALVGRYPMNESDLTSIVGEEISVDYNGMFGLSDEMERKIESEKRSFTDYVKDNKKHYFNNLLVDSGYVSILMTLPPMVIIPLGIASMVSRMSGLLAITSILVFTFLISLCLTTYKSHKSYKQNRPIEEPFGND